MKNTKILAIAALAVVMAAMLSVTYWTVSRSTSTPVAESHTRDIPTAPHTISTAESDASTTSYPTAAEEIPLPILPPPAIIQSQFPALHITSSYDPFQVAREFWHSGTMSLTNHADAFQNVDIRIRGRGNSTWHFGEEKRPLRLRFETPQSLLGSEYIARDWVLIANHFDLTLMRTYLAFYLANLLDGMDWNASAQFVHLYINGEYVGIYQVSDERDIQPGRMQLIFDENPAVSEYLFELDNNSLNGGIEGVEFFFANGEPYDIRYPRNQRLSTAHVEYMRVFVEEVAEVLRTGDFEAISAVMDLPSFIDFYLVQELFKNIDVGFNSVFMQVRGQGENRRMYWGPVWDFDRSAGNMYYWYSYEHLHAAVRNQFMRYMMVVPEIFDMAAQRWEEIASNQVPQMMQRIDFYAENYRDAFDRNFERFPLWEYDPLPQWMIDLVPPHLHDIDSWYEQTAFLKEWFTGRIWWMNQIFIHDENLREWWLDYLKEDGE